MRPYYQIRDDILLESIAYQTVLEDKPSASTGIYYLAPMTQGWQVIACRYAEANQELDHSAFWEWHVCGSLAGMWSMKVARPFNGLRRLLKEHPYGLPRGRVACLEGKYHVYHGSDIPKASRVTRGQIEAIFGIKGTAKWVKDDHEHCLAADKAAVREALALEEDWCAV